MSNFNMIARLKSAGVEAELTIARVLSKATVSSWDGPISSSRSVPTNGPAWDLDWLRNRSRTSRLAQTSRTRVGNSIEASN